MPSHVANDHRDTLMTLFRERVCETLKVAPFLHQRQVWAATDGLLLELQEDPAGASVRLDEGIITHYRVVPRPEGRARFVSDLGAFKIGKSYGAALWACGFAAVPGALVSLVGAEYDICAPEFNYICEALLSERGMNLKFDSMQNRPRDGKMWLDLKNGMRYEARSWERRESLKGKENDCYLFCEAYQLPGIECFTSVSQNLRARRGYAYFATTPDRPWIKDLHRLGWNHHGPDADPEWHCTCNVAADVNPFTFDSKAKKRDALLMTKEKYAIHYEGKLGEFVGHVFNYFLGEATFTADTHPHLFVGGRERSHLRIPRGWEIVGGCDTGTFYSAGLVAFDPDGNAYVLDEFPNYTYVSGAPEINEALSIPEWASVVQNRAGQLGDVRYYYADANSQFKKELMHYGMRLTTGTPTVETRTEIAREYFAHRRIFLAPWLRVLPFELENAAWPQEASATGRFSRVKDRDHSLDWLEHILSKRPRGVHARQDKEPGLWRDQFRGKVRMPNPHLGRF